MSFAKSYKEFDTSYELISYELYALPFRSRNQKVFSNRGCFEPLESTLISNTIQKGTKFRTRVSGNDCGKSSRRAKFSIPSNHIFIISIGNQFSSKIAQFVHRIRPFKMKTKCCDSLNLQRMDITPKYPKEKPVVQESRE